MNLLNKISMNYLPKVDANKCDFFILTTISLRQVFFSLLQYYCIVEKMAYI